MRKLEGFQPSPAGMERQLLRKLPGILLAGTLIPCAFALFAPLLFPEATGQLQALAGLVLANALLVLGTAIGCLIVVVMKGYAWVADAYPLPDSDRPLRDYQ